MTSGKNNGSWSWMLPALIAVWVAWPGPARMSMAETSPQPERDAGSTGWNAEQLLETLARNRPARVRYEETAFSNLLTRPLKTQGTLRFIPPAGLEKHITAPEEERYLVEGESVFFESKAKGTKRTLSLHDYPALRAFIEAFRSTLANDLITLRRFYDVTLQGEPHRWVLILRPLDKAVQPLVVSVRFSGARERIGSIEILAPDGDRSVMIITADTP